MSRRSESRRILPDGIFGSHSDKINAILTGAGYNYRLVLKWLRLLLARIMAAILNAMRPPLTAPVVPST